MFTIMLAGPRGFGGMSAIDRVALDGIVQTLAIEHCSQRSVEVFRILWEADQTLVGEAMMARIEALQRIDVTTRDKGGEPIRWPDEWYVHVIQHWAMRKLVRVPHRTGDWARQLHTGKRTIERVRRRLSEPLAAALKDGVTALEPILVARGYVPNLAD